MAPKRYLDDDFFYTPYTLHASSPPKKKVKTAKTTATLYGQPSASGGSASSPSEKRLARFKPRCPNNISERVERVMTQRFYMLDRTRNGNELKEEFKVLGSTGNLYTVVIDKLPSCDCPDASKGNHCKHILFIFLKVLAVPPYSTHYYQKALLSSELEDIFRNAPRNPSSMASARVREVYEVATGAGSSAKKKAKAKEEPAPAKKPKKVFEDGDDCPVCYEALKDANESDLTFCEACSNALHKECFNQWRRTKAGGELTCVWCRSPWVEPLPNGGASGSKSVAGLVSVSTEGYLNLGRAAGMSRVRDTSSYYRGHYWEDDYY